MSTLNGGTLKCSFCGKGQKEVKKLIAGPGVYICDECIDLCNDIIVGEKDREDTGKNQLKVPKPVDIKAFLDDYVIGQESAKKSLAVAVHNHYKRINTAKSKKKDDVEIAKSNNSTEKVFAELREVAAALVKENSTAQFLNSPVAAADAKKLFLKKAIEGKVAVEVLSSILLMSDKGRLSFF